MFPITWNVIAMEAAACYVGECRNGPRDAKIAMTAEGIYGMLIYILTPLVFVGVLGAALTTADPLTLYTDFSSAIFGHGSWIKWFIGLPLILALLLSVLNAIMGTGRSLYQASEDGMLPRWFGKVNTHGVPARAMAFNVVASMVVVLFGSPVRIYIFSNAGYLFSCAMSLAGYFVYRQLRPAAERPLRLFGWVRFLALAIFLFWAVVYFYGGWNAPNIVVAPNSGPLLFILGLGRPSRPRGGGRRIMMVGTVRAGSPRSMLPWRRTNARAALPSAGVLLASTGKPFSDDAINRAAELAHGTEGTGGNRVRVITIARIHGSSFGLQHPGLMPNKKEKDAAQALVTHAIEALQKAGAKADGEVVITRAPGRSFARAARAVGVARVVIDDTGQSRLGKLEARTAARYVRLRLKNVDLAVV